jgi:hypothetical protein
MLSAVMVVLWQASPDLSGFAVVPVEAECVRVQGAAQTERSGMQRLYGFFSLNSATDGAE